MSRIVTVIRPRILMGFMLNFTLRMGGEEHLLVNGATVTFEVSGEEQVLVLEAQNNPSITDLAPLTIPAGADDVSVQLSVRTIGGKPHWYLELQ